mgnify:CR=1 FL=1
MTGPRAGDTLGARIVPAGWWQAARGPRCAERTRAGEAPAAGPRAATSGTTACPGGHRRPARRRPPSSPGSRASAWRNPDDGARASSGDIRNGTEGAGPCGIPARDGHGVHEAAPGRGPVGLPGEERDAPAGDRKLVRERGRSASPSVAGPPREPRRVGAAGAAALAAERGRDPADDGRDGHMPATDRGASAFPVQRTRRGAPARPEDPAGGRLRIGTHARESRPHPEEPGRVAATRPERRDPRPGMRPPFRTLEDAMARGARAGCNGHPPYRLEGSTREGEPPSLPRSASHGSRVPRRVGLHP